MRILIITDLYPPYVKGGYELRCKETADELSRRGHEILVLTSKWGTHGDQVQGPVHRTLLFNELIYSEKGDRKVTTRGLLNLGKRLLQIQWVIKSRRNYRITCQIITTNKPDMVFIWNMGFIGLTPVLAAQDLGVPTAFSLGDYWLLELRAELCENTNYLKKMYRTLVTGVKDFSQLKLQHLMPDSTVLKNAYVENGFPEGDLHVVTRGIQRRLITPPGDLAELPRKRNGFMKLLFVGRIVPDKAPDVAIHTVEILKTQHGMNDIQLDIVGRGSPDYISNLKQMVVGLKLEKNVNFLGWLDHSVILEHYPDYDALIFPSRWVEPLGGTVLEAMSRGLPVISSQRGGPVEIISDGKDGFLVQVDDPAAFADAVLKLAQNEELTCQIRLAAIKKINERYTLEHIVDQYVDYFQRMFVSTV